MSPAAPVPVREFGRRALLRASAVLAVGGIAGWVSGCRAQGGRRAGDTPKVAATPSQHPAATPTATPTASRSADEVTAARVAAAERDLLIAYDNAIAAFPELTPQLMLLRADHVEHLRALDPTASPPSPATSASASAAPPPSMTGATATASASASASAPSGSPTVAAARAAKLRELGALERAAAADRLDDLVATSGNLARVLASIGACEAAHTALLGDLT